MSRNRLIKKQPDPWHQILTGSLGQGKSYTSLSEIYNKNTSNILSSFNPVSPTTNYNTHTTTRKRRRKSETNGESNRGTFQPINNIQPVSSTAPSQGYSTDGTGGQWTNPNQQQPYGTSQPPYQYPYGSGSAGGYPQQIWTNEPFQSPSITITWPNTASPLEPQKHTVEELKGKLIAYATITVDGKDHKGVLFVRKCGAWKLIECETMKKIASGGKDSPMPEVIVHYVIYSHFEDDKKKKKGRFEDIEMKTDK